MRKNALLIVILFTVLFVSGCIQQPPVKTQVSVSRIDPSFGPVGTIVTIYGSGFTPNGNTVKFGSGYLKGLNSADGATLQFIVPGGLDTCAPDATNCPQGYPQVRAGEYAVSVITIHGGSNGEDIALYSESNAVTFTVTASGNELPFETIAKGSYGSHSERKNYVITNESEWTRILQETDSELPAPIDFTQYTVLAVFQGQHSSGGYDIAITKVVDSPNVLEVFVKETSPGPECAVTEAFTQPYHIVKIQKMDKETLFRTTEEVTRCGKLATGWQG